MCRVPALAVSADAPPKTETPPHQTNVRVLNALTGELRCNVAVELSWTLSRLKLEIARLEGTPASEQQLLLPAGVAGAAGAASTLDPAGPAALGDALAGSEVVLMLRARKPGSPPASLRPGKVHISTEGAQEGGASQIVQWGVDTREFLKGSTCEVSPTFELRTGCARGGAPRAASFKLAVLPHRASSFRAAQGRGVIQLKCQSDPDPSWAPLRFRISLGAPTGDAAAGAAADAQDRPSVETHDFNQCAVWRAEGDPWHMSAAASAGSCARDRLAVVRLEVLDSAAPPPP